MGQKNGFIIEKIKDRENEIKVSEYVRTNGGYIGKIIKIKERKGRNCDTYYVCDNVMASGFYEHIVKHSSNIIDLIEVGDYINGYKVINVTRDKTFGYVSIDKINKNTSLYETLTDVKINSIVTEEQFEGISYKIPEEN